MKINKKNLGEYIGYFSIALVCVLSLVLSFGIVELYQQPIVANAQVIDGIDYPPINVDTLDVFKVYENITIGNYEATFGRPFVTLYLDVAGSIDFVPYNTYYIVFDGDFYGYGLFVPSNNFPSIDRFSVVSDFILINDDFYLSNGYTDSFIVYSSVDEEYYLFIDNSYEEFPQNMSVDIIIYSFPSSDSSDTSFADSFFSSIGDGISYGFESLTSGITYTMDNLFLIDGELSHFSIMLFLLTGVSLAMAVLKFILGFVFNWRDK